MFSSNREVFHLAVVSVVIPAHNEESVIARCLSALHRGVEQDTLEIIVVCNGCSDRTADVARTFEGVKVLEIPRPSKVAALNSGDECRSDLPVAYVDADVELTGHDLLVSLEALKESGASVVSPSLNVDLSNANVLVRAFYKIWMRLPYFSERRMIGSGVYLLSVTGRKRFGHFPQVISDDGYVRSLFTDEERLTVANSEFRIVPPSDLQSLIKIKTRSRLGNEEIKRRFPNLKVGGENTPSAFRTLIIQSPWLITALIIYIFVQWRTAKNVKERLVSGDFGGWARDESSRKKQ